MKNVFDVAIIGGGAAALFALRGLKDRKTVIIEAGNKLGAKLLITGGGKCNFINKYINNDNFQSSNPHFIKSFLHKFTTNDFLKIINHHKIPYEERDNGKLFTLTGAKYLLEALIKDGKSNNLHILLNSKVTDVSKENDLFKIKTNNKLIVAKKLIVASGGLSFPKLNASNIAYKIAEKFNIKVIKLKPALTSIKYPANIKNTFSSLSGISINAEIVINKRVFRDELLFTHTGFSGPLSLNTSLFIDSKNQEIKINFVPELNVIDFIKDCKSRNIKKSLNNIFSFYLPKALIKVLLSNYDYNLSNITNSQIAEVSKILSDYRIIISDVDGYNKAEVTSGGVSVDEIYQSSMESKKCSNLYFIGECLDMTGMLGGYNLYWAWASAKVLIDNLQK